MLVKVPKVAIALRILNSHATGTGQATGAGRAACVVVWLAGTSPQSRVGRVRQRRCDVSKVSKEMSVKIDQSNFTVISVSSDKRDPKSSTTNDPTVLNLHLCTHACACA